MLPIRDNILISSTPYVTIGLIIVNTLVFLAEYTQGPMGMQRVTWKYGYVPAKLAQSRDEFATELAKKPPIRPVTDRFGRPLVNPFNGQPLLEPDQSSFDAALKLPASVNIFTCMFLHGGWMHLIGNMLFLWIFGNNVEDRLGPLLYLIFYIGTGVCGNLLHTFFQHSYVPLVGASGAISGVMGGYFLLFPRARVVGIVPLGWYPATVSLPAWLYLIFYLVAQNLFPAFRGNEATVAYWAHIGGFLSGMALIYVFPHRPASPQGVPVYRPEDDDADIVF